MFEKAMTLDELKKRKYGVWAGNPNGQAYDPTRCGYEVCNPTGFGHYHQCSRKNGKGPGGLYCGIHAKKV